MGWHQAAERRHTVWLNRPKDSTMFAARSVLILALSLALSGLAACGKSERSTESAEQTPADAIAAAIANPKRLGSDTEEDSWRKPAEVLQFLQVRPGAHIIDYFAAGGYFTELLSYAVGPQGKVIAYNNQPYLKFAGAQPERRYGEDRLPNVTQLTAAPEALELEPQSLDGALFMLSYHDLYWRSKNAGWPETDAAQALQRLVPALKPGAAVVVVDHAAVAGSDPLQIVDTLHRIDPQIVKRDFTAAGLEFEAESPVLQHPEDDRTKPVFDLAVRRKTDRFIYRFRKR
jgi:predicted methyltransferase